MTNRMLENKNALIHGAGGAISGAVARALARQGAKVFLAGRTVTKLDAVARDISAAGGVAETAQVDALDERAVNAHADAVAARAGSGSIASGRMRSPKRWRRAPIAGTYSGVSQSGRGSLSKRCWRKRRRRPC